MNSARRLVMDLGGRSVTFGIRHRNIKARILHERKSVLAGYISSCPVAERIIEDILRKSIILLRRQRGANAPGNR